MSVISTTPNQELMRQARESLAGKWGLAAAFMLIYNIVILGIGALPFGPIASNLVAGPFMLGMTLFFLAVARNHTASISQLFDGFHRFGTSLLAYILMNIFILLWALLLILPGIIAAYSYALTFFILADDPAIHATDAIGKSKQLMRGNKWKLFCLHCRFIGWAILCILTFGIGFLWLIPYMQVSNAKFYNEIMGTAIEDQPIEALPLPSDNPVNNSADTL